MTWDKAIDKYPNQDKSIKNIGNSFIYIKGSITGPKLGIWISSISTWLLILVYLDASYSKHIFVGIAVSENCWKIELQ